MFRSNIKMKSKFELCDFKRGMFGVAGSAGCGPGLLSSWDFHTQQSQEFTVMVQKSRNAE